MSAEITLFRSRAEIEEARARRTIRQLLSLHGVITKEQFDAGFDDFAKQAGRETVEFIDALRRELFD